MMSKWTTIADEVAKELEERVDHGDETGEISRAGFETIKQRGLSSALVPEESGGGGATHGDMVGILRTLGASDPSTALTLSMHSHVVAAQVWRHNQGLDASGVFTKAVDGVLFASCGASDWIESNGTARKVDGGYVISCRKMPISGCEVADELVASARWEDGPEGPSVVHCSIPMSAEGVSIEQTWDAMGLRATGSQTVVFDEVFVPDAAVSLVRPAGSWHPIWSTVIGAALPLIMAGYVGIADRAVAEALEMTRTRGAHPDALIGEMMNAHTTAADVLDAMVRSSDNLHFDNTEAHAALTMQRKTIVTQAAIETVRLAIETVGGSGYSRGLPFERLYRDVHGCLFHPSPRARQIEMSGRVARGELPVG